jgi:hypothetical protein
VQQLKTKVRELLVPKNTDPWPEVRDDLNRRLWETGRWPLAPSYRAHL